MTFGTRTHYLESHEFAKCIICDKQIENVCMELRCHHNNFIAAFLYYHECTSEIKDLVRYHYLLSEIIHLVKDEMWFSNGELIKLIPTLADIEAQK